MSIVDTVMRRPEVIANPPVLLDIGASGGTHGAWKPIAPYCICVAFDGDERSLPSVAGGHGYRQLFVHHAAATPIMAERLDFHVTRSAECSSTLRPISESLDQWAFAPQFDVQQTTSVPAQTVAQALIAHGLSHVDWFKTDSQGTDLRLFRSLGPDLCARVLAVDFEPGIIDAYAGEDKLHHVLAEMDHLPFWAYALTIRGSSRVSRRVQDSGMSALARRALPLVVPAAPGWAEISYFNTLPQSADFDLRDHLVCWVFATIRNQHGFALDVAARAAERFVGEPLCGELLAHSRRRLVPSPMTVARGLLRRAAQRLLAAV